eukprot:6188309-Amphidinium_carterae.1
MSVKLFICFYCCSASVSTHCACKRMFQCALPLLCICASLEPKGIALLVEFERVPIKPGAAWSVLLGSHLGDINCRQNITPSDEQQDTML